MKGLAGKGPEEDNPVRFSEPSLEPVEDGTLGGIVELLLQDRRPDPGADENGDDGRERDPRPGLDVDRLPVEQEGDDEGAEDAGEVGEERREGPGPDGEVRGQPGADEAVVEIGDEEGRQEQQDAARGDQGEDGLELGRPRGLLPDDSLGAVAPPDLLRGAQAQRQGQAEAHDGDEDDVRGGADGPGRRLLRVEAEVDGAAHDGARRLGRLPDGEVEGPVARGRVPDDDGGLGGPEEARRDAAQRGPEQHEPRRRAHVVGVEPRAVQRVAHGAERQAVPQPDPVVDRPGRHTYHGE